jgi:hypothetical protein
MVLALLLLVACTGPAAGDATITSAPEPPSPVATPTRWVPSPLPTPTEDSNSVQDLEPSLGNPGFETPWEVGQSHRVLVIYPSGDNELSTRETIFTPPGWLTWFRTDFQSDPEALHEPVVEAARGNGEPDRSHGGEWSIRLSTSWRRHDAGFVQQVPVIPGTALRVSAWAHAWSNHEDPDRPEEFPFPNDPSWSEGEHVGWSRVAFRAGAPGLDEGDQNIIFQIGIDPNGGIDPFSENVVWGSGIHIYNDWASVPSATAVASEPLATVFLRSITLWPFKHNEAYWDDVTLEVVRLVYLPSVIRN